MAPEEIRELLELKGWLRVDLAAALRCSEQAIIGWLSRGRNPRGPAVVLMRQWLDEARKAKKVRKVAR